MNHFSRLLGVLFLLSTSHNYAQTKEPNIPETPQKDSLEDKEDANRPFQFNLTIKNMHLWRGYRVTDEAMTAANVHYVSKDGNFKAGLWGGVGFAGSYTEFDYYLSYDYKNWTFAIWDINNYTDFPEAKIFNYDRAETSHFIDVSATYRFNSIPLQLSWSTIVQGRDTYVDTDGELKNAFTNYIEASYIVAQGKDWNVGVFVGAAFSFESESNFYGDRAGFNNFGISYSKTLSVLDSYSLPVSATAMWNDLQDYGALQVAVDVF